MEFFNDAEEENTNNGTQAVLFVIEYNKYSPELILHRLRDLFYMNVKHKVGCVVFNHPLESIPDRGNERDALLAACSQEGIRVLLPMDVATTKCYDALKQFKISGKSTLKSNFGKVFMLICHIIKPCSNNSANIVFVTDQEFDLHSTVITKRIQDLESYNAECQLVGTSNLSQLMTRDVNIFETKPKKASADTTLKIGALSIGIKVYMLYRPFKKPTPVKLDENDFPVKGKKKQKVLEYVMDEFGGKKNPIDVVYTAAERAQLRDISPVGLEVLRVIPCEPHFLGLKESKFVFPADHKITNSSKIFTALLDSCLSNNKALLVKSRTSKIQVPRHCVLIPRAEIISKGVQQTAAGFYMIELAVSDDIRHPQPPEATTVPEELVNSFSNLIMNTPINDYLKIDNPYMEAQRKKLQVLFLNEQEVVENAFEELKVKVNANVPEDLALLMSENTISGPKKRTKEPVAKKTKKTKKV